MLSIIVPVLNEEGSLAQLYRELRETADAGGYAMQIVMVDDGSTDGSWRRIEALAAADPEVHGVRFRRNFGKAAALSAGFDAAEGEVIVMIDADLQDSPREIPNLVRKLDEGFDVVSGWKRERRDPWHKRWPSKVFNYLVGAMTGVKLHDHNCGLKCFRRDVIHEIRLYGELHRFIPVLAAARGFRVGEVAVEHRPRQFGRSKYGLGRIPKGMLDLLTVQFITRFGHRPQHWLGSAGLAALAVGVLGMAYLAFMWCYSRLVGDEPIHLHQTAAMYYSLAAVLIGSNFLAIGFLAELIAAVVTRDRDVYSVAEQTGPSEPTRGSRSAGLPMPARPHLPPSPGRSPTEGESR